MNKREKNLRGGGDHAKNDPEMPEIISLRNRRNTKEEREIRDKIIRKKKLEERGMKLPINALIPKHSEKVF